MREQKEKKYSGKCGKRIILMWKMCLKPWDQSPPTNNFIQNEVSNCISENKNTWVAVSSRETFIEKAKGKPHGKCCLFHTNNKNKRGKTLS